MQMENDIPKSNILNIEIYMDKHAKEIVDSAQQEQIKVNQEQMRNDKKLVKQKRLDIMTKYG
jgi:hypothetical protein